MGRITKKIRLVRKTFLVALMISLQWDAIAFIQQSTLLSFVPTTTTRSFSRGILLVQQQHEDRGLFGMTQETLNNNVDANNDKKKNAIQEMIASWNFSPSRRNSEARAMMTIPTEPIMVGASNHSDLSAVSGMDSLATFWPRSTIEAETTTNPWTDVNALKRSTSLPPGLLSVIQTWVEPIQNKLDDVSSGYILSYADLRPDSPTTGPGKAFLATNLGYLAVGLILTMQGDLWLGTLTEICAAASYMYHYTQLEARGDLKAPTVRLAVLIDICFALLSMATATVYWIYTMLFAYTDTLPNLDILVSVVLSLSFLGLSWVYEKGRSYMFFHSLWHIFGAYTGFLIGSAHNHASIPILLSKIF